MRSYLATVAAIAALLTAAPVEAAARSPRATGAAQQTLRDALNQGLQAAGGSTGAYVVDMKTGQTLFSYAANVGRLPASVEKLYTTSTALLRFGPDATLTTSVLGKGTLDRRGGWHGTLYLKGGGDPTFGSAGFDQYAYGAGATIQRLASNLVRRAGIRSVHGRIMADESYFDSLRGTPPSGGQFSTWVEGSLSALVFERGLVNQGAGYVIHPAIYAAQQLASALRAAGTRVSSSTPISAGVTPAAATPLATVHSPRIATLIKLTNTPSDNFFAEMLLKGIGARFGGRGTTASGAAVVRSQLASDFGIHPQLEDGSGLSRNDFTSPRDVVNLLGGMASNAPFVNSLAIAGETGTLQYEMQGTPAQGRCRGKTGTLHDVASLVGYCQASDGHTLGFAFLMNSVDPAFGHSTEAQMAVALAQYNG
jgi:D-alanyl-D-alanine carboxypeptidase/D-alanyl-D-alanine-endopeptidase (penicillin-binding protein 4)